MNKTIIAILIILIIIIKPLFGEKLVLDTLNIFSVSYYLVLIILGFLLLKYLKLASAKFWLYMFIYLAIVAGIMAYYYNASAHSMAV